MYCITENKKVFRIEEKSCSQFLSVGEKIMKDSTKMLIRVGVYGVVAGITGYTGFKVSKPYSTNTLLDENEGSDKNRCLKRVYSESELDWLQQQPD